MWRIVAIGVCALGLLRAEESQARRDYEKTNYPAAIAQLQGAQDAHSLQLLGQSYFRNGDLKKATEVLERAAELAPNNSDVYLWLGRVFGRRAETAFPIAAPPLAVKSRQNFEKALALNPQNWEAADDLFEYYLEAPGFLGGGADKAEKIANQIALHDPAEAAYDHARLAEQRKQYDAAEQQLRRAVQLAPRRPGKILALARFLAKRGRFEESEAVFQQASVVAPDAPEVVYTHANTLVETNRKIPEARQLLKRYMTMSLGPNDPPRRDAEKLLHKVSGS